MLDPLPSVRHIEQQQAAEDGYEALVEYHTRKMVHDALQRAAQAEAAEAAEAAAEQDDMGEVEGGQGESGEQEEEGEAREVCVEP